MDIIGSIIHLIVVGLIGGLFVWLAGKALGAPKATYWHGILTVICAIILSDIINYFVGGRNVCGSLGCVQLTTILELIVILLLIKHFFAVGWLKSIVIAVLAIVIMIIVILVLALLGIAFAVGLTKGLIPGVPGIPGI